MSQLAVKTPPVKAHNYKHLTAIPQTGTFGALVKDVQIADAINNDELFADIHQAWLDYQVLFFRNQELTPEQQLRLGEQIPAKNPSPTET